MWKREKGANFVGCPTPAEIGTRAHSRKQKVPMFSPSIIGKNGKKFLNRVNERLEVPAMSS